MLDAEESQAHAGFIAKLCHQALGGHTPYSMHSLFNECFNNFGGLLLEALETI